MAGAEVQSESQLPDRTWRCNEVWSGGKACNSTGWLVAAGHWPNHVNVTLL